MGQSQPESTDRYPRVHTFQTPDALRQYLLSGGNPLPIADVLAGPGESPLGNSIAAGRLRIKNRFAIQPMEGWDGTPDGRPTASLERRWRRFGESGAGLIWGGEAFAVRKEGRANPNQLYLNENSEADLTTLRSIVLQSHEERFDGSAPVLGLQLTHSGRYCRPDDKTRLEPRIVYRHPVLDKRLGLNEPYPLVSDGELQSIAEDYIRAAAVADRAGFDFVDIKHCHGYLCHELLSARTRAGAYGGSFENRTRFLREIVGEIRRTAPSLEIGVRVSIFDFLPYKPDPTSSRPGRMGKGIPDDPGIRPYLFAFGADADEPADQMDLHEPIAFLQLLESLGIRLVNLTAGSPYYNPHIQRPAAYPPCDGYQPPEDPLVGVARQVRVAGMLKRQFPGLTLVGSAYTYLQEFLPHVAQAAVETGAVDIVGIGRLALSYPSIVSEILGEGALQHPELLCRTFSDCTTAPRNGLPSGCYPLDHYYKGSDDHQRLKQLKRSSRLA